MNQKYVGMNYIIPEYLTTYLTFMIKMSSVVEENVLAQIVAAHN